MAHTRKSTRMIQALVIVTLIVAPIAAQEAATAGVSQILPSGAGESVDRDIARARIATERFKIAAEAVTAGYEPTTTCVEHQPEGVMGLHYKNVALRDATLDVEHPEILLYQRTADGTLQLTGVEYIVPTSAWTHANVPTLMGQSLKRDQQLGIWFLHAWIWEFNPSGIFADWNPRAKC